MRWLLVCWLAACSESEPAPLIDGGPPGPPPPCTKSVPFTGGVGDDLALNGPLILVTAHDNSGHSLHELTASGADTTLFSSADPIPLGTRDSVAFFGRKQAAGYDIYMRVGSQDTLLGTVATTGTIEIGATTTDVYVLAPDGAVTRLWRIPRIGGTPVEVTSVDGMASTLHVGDTLAAIGTAGMYRAVRLPGPSAPEPVPSSAQFFVGDRGLTFGTMVETSHTSTWFVNEVYPTTTTVGAEQVHYGSAGLMFADDRFLYLALTQYPGQPPLLSTFRVVDLKPTGLVNSSLFCATFRATGGLAYNETQLFGLNGTKVTIGPRPH